MFDGAGEYHNKERMEWLIARGMEQLELLHDADVPLPGKPINGDAALENTVENLSISAKYANKTNMNLSGTTANLSDSNKYASQLDTLALCCNERKRESQSEARSLRIRRTFAPGASPRCASSGTRPSQSCDSESGKESRFSNHSKRRKATRRRSNRSSQECSDPQEDSGSQESHPKRNEGSS